MNRKFSFLSKDEKMLTTSGCNAYQIRQKNEQNYNR
jgi:hypothetical protein